MEKFLEFITGKNYFVVIKPNTPADSAIEVEEIEAVPDLAKLQSGVGGDIEIVPFWNTIYGRRCVAFCHEEGKLKGQPINHPANILWRLGRREHVDDVLVGQIVVIVGTPGFLAKL